MLEFRRFSRIQAYSYFPARYTKDVKTSFEKEKKKQIQDGRNKSFTRTLWNKTEQTYNFLSQSNTTIFPPFHLTVIRAKIENPSRGRSQSWNHAIQICTQLDEQVLGEVKFSFTLKKTRPIERKQSNLIPEVIFNEAHWKLTRVMNNSRRPTM